MPRELGKIHMKPIITTFIRSKHRLLIPLLLKMPRHMSCKRDYIVLRMVYFIINITVPSWMISFWVQWRWRIVRLCKHWTGGGVQWTSCISHLQSWCKATSCYVIMSSDCQIPPNPCKLRVRIVQSGNYHIARIFIHFSFSFIVFGHHSSGEPKGSDIKSNVGLKLNSALIINKDQARMEQENKNKLISSSLWIEGRYQLQGAF